jgi:hypothetical protein
MCTGDGELRFVLDRPNTDYDPNPLITNDFFLYSPQTIYTDSTLNEYDITNDKAKNIEPNITDHPCYSSINNGMVIVSPSHTHTHTHTHIKNKVITKAKVHEKSICDKIKSFVKSTLGLDGKIESIKMQKD